MTSYADLERERERIRSGTHAKGRTPTAGGAPAPRPDAKKYHITKHALPNGAPYWALDRPAEPSLPEEVEIAARCGNWRALERLRPENVPRQKWAAALRSWLYGRDGGRELRALLR